MNLGSLAALLYQHTITPIALPCCLRMPSYDPAPWYHQNAYTANTAAPPLVKQNGASNVQSLGIPTPKSAYFGIIIFIDF